MKVYRCSSGAWINLSLCSRFYVDKNATHYDIEAAIDHLDDQQVTLTLEDSLPTRLEAQTKLDEIMMKFRE